MKSKVEERHRLVVVVAAVGQEEEELQKSLKNRTMWMEAKLVERDHYFWNMGQTTKHF
jgi:aspartokinase